MTAEAPLNETRLDRELDQSRPLPHDEDPVEAALAKALAGAAAAGRFDVVALLAGELQARRLAREGVATLSKKARRRDFWRYKVVHWEARSALLCDVHGRSKAAPHRPSSADVPAKS